MLFICGVSTMLNKQHTCLCLISAIWCFIVTTWEENMSCCMFVTIKIKSQATLMNRFDIELLCFEWRPWNRFWVTLMIIQASSVFFLKYRLACNESLSALWFQVMISARELFPKLHGYSFHCLVSSWSLQGSAADTRAAS